MTRLLDVPSNHLQMPHSAHGSLFVSGSFKVRTKSLLNMMRFRQENHLLTKLPGNCHTTGMAVWRTLEDRGLMFHLSKISSDNSTKESNLLVVKSTWTSAWIWLKKKMSGSKDVSYISSISTFLNYLELNRRVRAIQMTRKHNQMRNRAKQHKTQPRVQSGLRRTKVKKSFDDDLEFDREDVDSSNFHMQ